MTLNPSPAHEDAGGEPLEAIAALERELAGRLSEARSEAERIIDEARCQADRNINEARASIPCVCEQLREATLSEHRRRADEIREIWTGERARLTGRAEARLPEAVDRLVSSFLEALGGRTP